MNIRHQNVKKKKSLDVYELRKGVCAIEKI